MRYTELLKKRRSIRDFQDRTVPIGTLEEIIEESCLAPSSGNRQAWRFVIIHDKRMLRRISDECKRNILIEIESDPEAYMSRYRGVMANGEHNIFYNAPCLVLVVGPKDNHTLQIDCTLVAFQIMLAAVARGLGTCWIGAGIYLKDPRLLDEICMTEEHRIVAPIVLGYPERIPAPAPRKPPRILKVVSGEMDP